MLVNIGYIFITLASLVGVLGLPFAGAMSSCEEPLGLESGNITNDQFSFPETSYYGGRKPSDGRLNGRKCYCTPTFPNLERWYTDLHFTIDLGATYVISSLGLQNCLYSAGSYGAGSYMKLFTYNNGKELLYNGSAIKLPQLKFKMDRIERVHLGPTDAEKIRIDLQGSQNHHCLRMEIYGCLKPRPTTKEEQVRNISLIVVVVLLILLFGIFVFLCYRYRKSMCTRWHHKKQKYNSSVYDQVQDARADHYLQEKQYSKDPCAEQIYSTINVSNSADSDLLLNDNHHQGNAQYDDPVIRPDSPSQIYEEPGAQYPDVSKRESLVYYGSAIYGTTYENPYKSTISSCIYAEPDKFLTKGLIREFPRAQLNFLHQIGVGQFGEVHICEATGLDDIYGNIGHSNSWGLPDTALVAVKMLKCTDSEVEEDFMQEVEVMAALKDENVVRLLGICSEHPKLMVVEYMKNGDLNEFLSCCRPSLQDQRGTDGENNVLTVDQLIHMSQQISSGMKYLHSLDFIHRDLATRNCLVGHAYKVKIADFGMSRDIYSEHYYRVEGKAILPIRWMAPECIYYGKFTLETDVWSFGVTLWEIFSFARESPYHQMTDTDVIEAACEHLQNQKDFPYILQPQYCPDDIYEVILQCWSKDPRLRPTFAFLSEKLLAMCAILEVNI